MLSRKELEEFQADKAKVAEDRVAYRKHMSEHANVLEWVCDGSTYARRSTNCAKTAKLQRR